MRTPLAPLPRDQVISDDEILRGEKISLRLVRESDCTPRYEAWLADPVVNQFLETRWSPQPLGSIVSFVQAMRSTPANYLFAILDPSGTHIGNLKVGPIIWVHGYADISYFLGERSAWGHGYATDAIRVATRFAFERLGLYRVQAGVYASNIASCRALERAGLGFEARFEQQLRGPNGWEDHVFYASLRNKE